MAGLMASDSVARFLQKYLGKLLGLPLAYGMGTALPVLDFAFRIAFGSEYLGAAFNRLTLIERWVRRAAGNLLILAGIYYTLTHPHLRPQPVLIRRTCPTTAIFCLTR